MVVSKFITLQHITLRPVFFYIFTTQNAPQRPYTPDFEKRIRTRQSGSGGNRYTMTDIANLAIVVCIYLLQFIYTHTVNCGVAETGQGYKYKDRHGSREENR